MKKSNILVLSSALIVTVLLGTCINASASIWVCWNGDPCFETEGSCDGWCSGSSGQPTCSDCGALFFNPHTDYILALNGEAWVVHNGTETRIASDDFVELQKELFAKYGKHPDKKAQMAVSAAYERFLKIDNHKVSKSRLEINSRETGLKIRTK